MRLCCAFLAGSDVHGWLSILVGTRAEKWEDQEWRVGRPVSARSWECQFRYLLNLSELLFPHLGNEAVTPLSFLKIIYKFFFPFTTFYDDLFFSLGISVCKPIFKWWLSPPKNTYISLLIKNLKIPLGDQKFPLFCYFSIKAGLIWLKQLVRHNSGEPEKQKEMVRGQTGSTVKGRTSQGCSHSLQSSPLTTTCCLDPLVLTCPDFRLPLCQECTSRSGLWGVDAWRVYLFQECLVRL